MERLEIILSSYSIGDASYKIFGYSNGTTKKKISDLLIDNNMDLSIFENKNKNIKYEKIYKKCPVCKNNFETLLGYRKEKKTCSIACSNTLNPKRKKDKEKSKTKRQKENNKICEKCSRIYEGTKKSKFCSSPCRNDYLRELIRNKIADGSFKGWQKRSVESYPEKFFKKVLDNNKISYEFNFPVSKSSLGIKKDSSCYFLDFYIIKNNIKIDLEIDGKQHKIKKRSDGDNKRDNILRSNEYLVYRIPWKSINTDKGKKYIKKEIEKFLDWYYLI
jgi:hypothetical protein